LESKTNMETHINVLGLMSGTSLDGLDLCLTKFNNADLADYSIEACTTVSFPEQLKMKLATAHELTAFKLQKLSNEFANFSAHAINTFKKEYGLNIDLIGSHGHTVYHKPEAGVTLQIGNGANIYANTGIKTVSDFRSVDVALGGQGAPLVPIGDLLLFPNYESCLNLGGIANISIKTSEGIQAHDVSFMNMATNYICQEYLNIPYDNNGSEGEKGNLLPDILNIMTKETAKLNKQSLAREHFEALIKPVLNQKHSPQDLLRTCYEYSSNFISETLNHSKNKKCLVTGGGAHNNYFIQLLQKKTTSEIIIPDKNTIDFKEALIFSFLALKRLKNEANTLKQVTHATKDNIGGCIYG